ncbi:MAG: hypothetical protein HY054_04455 [Proteobacteria bacterium]|nr:hypothetical protein [Pseudomonadota bacterium]
MRIVALALVSVLAMAACSPGAPSSSSSGTAAAPPSGGASNGFPQGGNVSFRQTATMTIGGSAVPEVIYHDGAKMRTEMNGPMGHMTSIIDNDTHEAFNIMHVAGRTMATRTDLSQLQTHASTTVDMDAMRAQMQARAHRLGDCSAGGEHGGEWTVDAPAGAATTSGTRSMCVTNDGIMIQMKMDGNVVFDTQSLQRGPQDPSLFQLPPGVQVTETHIPSQASIADAMARARAAAAAAQGHP